MNPINVQFDISDEAGWTIFGTTVSLVLLGVVYLNTTQTSHEESQILAALQAGIDPIEAGCAFNVRSDACINYIKEKTNSIRVDNLLARIEELQQ